VGQTNGQAIVIEGLSEVDRLDFNKDIRLYSQTTKSLDEFRQIVEYIQAHISPEATFEYHDTICRQVANRMPHIREFSSRHDVILFVCGKKSSNGRVLFSQCLDVNPRSYMIDTASEVDPSWLQDCSSIGICGATSTPKWLMEECKVRIQELLGCNE
jgi:4-hydroxy-3-methylbut-2-enyl diphosphate reductase